ncbi:MAG: hypothetical protein VXX11_03600 [Planctomycetota bacterium]|nr:hypothetical protein [Planctomycetota bacterium]
MNTTYEEKQLHSELIEAVNHRTLEGQITSVGLGYDLSDGVLTLGITLQRATPMDTAHIWSVLYSFAYRKFNLDGHPPFQFHYDPEGLTLQSFSFKPSDAFTVIPRKV